MEDSRKIGEMIGAKYKEDFLFSSLSIFSFPLGNLGYLGSNSVFTIY